MSNFYKIKFLNELEKRFGKLKKLPKSYSLFDLPNSTARIYVRYSKIHRREHSFYGLRDKDLNQLGGLNSFICFIWDQQKEPIFIPYSEFEDVFREITPASDGQYKAHIFHQPEQNELYIAHVGKFNVESFFGWEFFKDRIDSSKITKIPDFTHSQIQTFIGAIGKVKGFDIWIPKNDRNKLDWGISSSFNCVKSLPDRFKNVNDIIKEVDVIWIKRGSTDLQAMFEIEHSTPIYSGLLRFNDLHLIEPNLRARFSIISNYIRKTLFLRQINRPTFRSSGISEICNFLEYKDVLIWFNRTLKK